MPSHEVINNDNLSYIFKAMIKITKKIKINVITKPVDKNQPMEFVQIVNKNLCIQTQLFGSCFLFIKLFDP